MTPNCGVETREQLDHWKKILHKWCNIIDRLSPIMIPDDRPWWESEKANAGLIAAAAIECNIACFLETSVKRGGGRGISNLWLKFRSERGRPYGSEQEFVELKLDGAHDGRISTVKFEEAMGDAQAIKEDECRAKIGACLYKISGQSPTLDISALIRRFREILDHPHAIAWSFPECTRPVHTDQKYHLGAVLVLKKCV